MFKVLTVCLSQLLSVLPFCLKCLLKMFDLSLSAWGELLQHKHHDLDRVGKHWWVSLEPRELFPNGNWPWNIQMWQGKHGKSLFWRGFNVTAYLLHCLLKLSTVFPLVLLEDNLVCKRVHAHSLWKQEVVICLLCPVLRADKNEEGLDPDQVPDPIIVVHL